MKSKLFIIIVCAVITITLFGSGLFILLHKDTADGTSVVSKLIPSIMQNFQSQKPVNVLMMVGDKAECNTDTMMVINYNPSTAKMSVLSIPRDTKVQVSSTKTSKVNAAYAIGGPDKSVEVVSRLLGIDIEYYVYFNIKTFKEIIDALGGVYYDVPVDLKYDDPTQDLHIDLKKGYQKLDGDKAEQLLRFRKPQHGYTQEMLQYYDGSDLNRIVTQQKFVKALIEQKMNLKYLPKIKSIFESVFKNMKTNITVSDALKLGSNVVKLKQDEMNTFRLWGEGQSSGAYYYVYSHLIYDTKSKEKLEANDVLNQYFVPLDKELMASIDQGQTAATSTPKPKSKPKPTPKPTVPNTPTPNPSNNETNIEPSETPAA